MLARNVSRYNNGVSFPFDIVIVKSGGVAGPSVTSVLSYDSLSKIATSILGNNVTTRQISDSDEQVAKRVLNNSGFFSLNASFYLPASGSSDYVEYTAVATLKGRAHAVYWTDTSEGVPEGIRNLPYIMAYLLGTERVS